MLPDNVLFESGIGRQIRADLMDKCNLHTILRLPTGIFYAQGVKTNVLFFTRGETDKGNTKEVWVYDLRANMPQFGKRTVLTQQHFSEFETAFGSPRAGARLPRTPRPRARYPQTLPPSHPCCRHLWQADVFRMLYKRSIDGNARLLSFMRGLVTEAVPQAAR